MNISRLKALLGATALTIVAAGAAQAGGFSRGTADTDILYEQGNFNLRTSVTVVNPTRKYTVNPYPDGTGYDYADTYVVPSAAVKFKIFDELSCAGTISQPYGGGVTFRPPGNGTLFKLEEDFTVMEYGATCAFQYSMGKGRISVLGGAFIENVDYNLVGANGARVVDLKDNAVGWRAGIAYEIQEIAFRAQLMYRSGTKVEASGTTTAYVAPPPALPLLLPAAGFAELPQSVELKVQSGIAPGWLAYGSVKWTDWSVNEQLVLILNTADPVGSRRVNDYFWNDGWTVTGGIAHSFSDSFAGTVFATWDQGVGTGWDLQSDTYTVGTGISLKDKIGGELRAGVGISYLTAVSETQYGPANRAVGNDWSFAFSGGYSVKW